MASINELSQESNPNESNIIYITEEPRCEWTYDATKELLKIYDEKVDMLDTGIINTHKKLWEITTREMAKKDFHFTPAQCENKWKTLKRAYKSKLERVQKFGHCKRMYPFEYEVGEILSKRPHNKVSTKSYFLKISELKKEEQLFNQNLNEPPGFTKDEDEYEEEYFYESEDVKGENDSKHEDQQPSEGEQTTYAVVPESNQAALCNEISDLKRVINQHNKVNAQILQQVVDTQDRICRYLTASEEREDKRLEIEEKRLRQENQMVEQMKIQNSLLQKFLAKF